MKTHESILDYNITTLSKTECISTILRWLENIEKHKYFICANPHSLELARNDSDFSAAIENADLVTPDGVGIVIASKILGGNIYDRITGSDVFIGLSNVLNKKRKYSYFFLGSTEKTLEKIKDRMKVVFPNIKIAGTYSPPFKEDFSKEDNSFMIEAINNAKPDVLWVGMTAPKQEKWIYHNKDKLNVSFIGAVGAAFDYFAGTKKRAPVWLQHLGLEWLPRLMLEPWRLWKRNFVSSPMFLGHVLIAMFKQVKSKS